MADRPARPQGTAPILFEGICETFIAMRERDDQLSGAVGRNAIGRSSQDNSLDSPTDSGNPPADSEGPCALQASREHCEITLKLCECPKDMKH